MHKASAPILFLVGLLVLAVVGGATFAVGSVVGLGDDDDGPAEPVLAAEPTTTTSTAPLADDQVVVTGVATAVTVEGAVLGGVEVVLPTISTPSAGLGSGARFEGAVVDDETAAIAWDAGRPLDFGDATPLRLRPAVVDLAAAPGGVVVTFPDGEAIPVVPGGYEIDAPVAVTTTGLGSPRDSVTFTATEATTVAFTGSASGTMPVGAVSATGPGRVVLQGTFEVRRPDGTTATATAVELPSGSFRIAFTPTADGAGFTLDDALLEGAVVVS